MNKKQFEEGNKKRKKVLGTKYVNQAIKDKNYLMKIFKILLLLIVGIRYGIESI